MRRICSGSYRLRNNDVESAIRLIRDAIERDPDNPLYHANLGNVLKDSGRLTEAIVAYRRALELHPGYAEVHNNLGYVLQASGMIEEGIGHYRKAIALRPDDYRARFNLGNALFLIGKDEDAVAAFREAARLNPGYADDLGPSRNRAAAARPARGGRRVLSSLDRDRPRLGRRASRALALDLQQQGRIAEAFDCLSTRDRAAAGFPSGRRLGALAGPTTLRLDDDRGLLRRRASPRCRASRGCVTFSTLFVARREPCALLTVARAHAATIAAKEPMRQDTARFERPSRIRVGYLSSDFHGHPIAYLTAEVFELHDRERFEVFLFSYGPDDGSAMRAAAQGGMRPLHRHRSASGREAAKRIYDERIQILVDLKGYTADDRPRIAAAPARTDPGQLARLSGLDGCRLDRLPHCRPVRDPAGTRSRLLGEGRASAPLLSAERPQAPERIRPAVAQRVRVVGDRFRLLLLQSELQDRAARVRDLDATAEERPESVLWLLDENSGVEGQSAQGGESATASRPSGSSLRRCEPLAEHLARYALADLALDTFPDTSHTTGSDALWAGCPLVTLMGETFASRVAGEPARQRGARAIDCELVRRIRSARLGPCARSAASRRLAATPARPAGQVAALRLAAIHARPRSRLPTNVGAVCRRQCTTGIRRAGGVSLPGSGTRARPSSAGQKR